jgi:hypothetical protein
VHEAVYASETWGPWDPPLPPLDPHPPLLAFDGARALLEARDAGATRASISLDFHKGPDAELRLDAERGVFLDETPARDETRDETDDEDSPNDCLHDDPSPETPLVTWSDVSDIAADEKGAYVLRRGLPAERFQVFSEDTGRAASLMPVGGGFAPTALLAGFSMHRFGVGVDPMEDTERKLNAIKPIRPGARVLDVCTGLAVHRERRVFCGRARHDDRAGPRDDKFVPNEPALLCAFFRGHTAAVRQRRGCRTYATG